MNESRLKDEELSTADIAYPKRARFDYENDPPVAGVEDNRQPGGNYPPADSAYGSSVSGDTASKGDAAGPLFADAELSGFRTRWDQVQTSFVDEPREAVRSADSLVANVVQRIAEQFAQERDQLEHQWDSGTNVSTEDLRQSLKRYRALFGRLLAF